MSPNVERAAILIMGAVIALYGLIALVQRGTGMMAYRRRRDAVYWFATLFGGSWLVMGGLLVFGALLGGRFGAGLIGLTAVAGAVLFGLLFVSFIVIQVRERPRPAPASKPQEPGTRPLTTVLPTPPLPRFPRRQHVFHEVYGEGTVLESNFVQGSERVSVLFQDQVLTVDAATLRLIDPDASAFS